MNERRNFSIFSATGTLLDAVYFWFSFTSLVARTFVMALTASDLHLETKKPLKVFASVSRASWCEEVKCSRAIIQYPQSVSLQVRRFNLEVSSDVIALTGMKFFNITRNFILSVTTTVITYEILLIQMQMGSQGSQPSNDFCNVE